jgi:hypothetical protein
MFLLIGLHGKKRSGKDLAASQLYGFSSEEKGSIAFAEPIKLGCMEMFGLSYSQVFGDEKEIIDPRYGKTPREILQWMGTEVIRDQFHKDHWLNLAREKIESFMNKHPKGLLFLTDVRYDNEAELIKSFGGRMIEIRRNQANENKDSHASEQGVSTRFIDAVIENHTNDPDDLFESMENVLCSFVEQSAE